METLDSLQLRLYRIVKSADHLFWFIHAYTEYEPTSPALDLLLKLQLALQMRHDIALPVEDVEYETMYAESFKKVVKHSVDMDIVTVTKEIKDLLVHVKMLLNYWEEVEASSFIIDELQPNLNWAEWKSNTHTQLLFLKEHLADLQKSLV